MEQNTAMPMIQAIEQQTGDLVARALTLAVIDQASYDNALLTMKEIKAMKKTVEATFQPIVQAAYEAHKRAKAGEKLHTDPLDKAEAQLKTRCTAWYNEQERIRREEEQRRQREEAEARAVAEALGIADEPMEAPVMAPEKPAGTFQEYWSFEITDLAALPREYMVPDMKAIGETVRRLKDATKIPGVKVSKERRMVNR